MRRSCADSGPRKIVEIGVVWTLAAAVCKWCSTYMPWPALDHSDGVRRDKRTARVASCPTRDAWDQTTSMKGVKTRTTQPHSQTQQREANIFLQEVYNIHLQIVNRNPDTGRYE
ncbi:hypothetical protein PHLGIDRAFT_147757 [Phlebiopsis gigantea 11061_1 CR5-6]|uniref:Uncharacterized protein n=1 Tax=Phlebiopsis gigantea (strain 11061_1 CR5-6) TaxID=745531 RepID=A0A0C3NKL5_PHLG1|nr:hypothetical protein PHLGIDRAFT_147757 [Phlebiopsis gigantea 11061_1 CR5-6]